MRKFNLQSAMLGANICTRDGRPAVIKHVRNSSFAFPVICNVLHEDGTWNEIRYKQDGREFGYGDSVNDLFMR